ncbi:MAG TPA: CPBP family glutamic-type intramembrane protease, partial [Enteractinococcus sp.]
AMVIFCTVIGGVLAWLTIRTNSVWPAALGHSTINATAALPLLFSADTTYDTAHVGIAGTTGWLVTAGVLLILFLTKSFRTVPAAPLDPARAWPGD